MQLHEEVGPRATTISAIAQRAGVQRLTVYRHFPDETAVFAACTSRWLELHPPLEPADWASCEAGVARVRAALQAFYRYYRDTQRMWHAAHRDESEVPALQGPMAGFRDHLCQVSEGLHEDLGATEDPRLVITLQHGLAFTTWASLEAQGLDDAAMAELVVAWLEGLTG